MVKLFVLRHAETGAEKLGITLGRIDWPLNDTGRNFAKIAAQKFIQEHNPDEIKAIITSPMQRTKQTAEIFQKALGCQMFVELLIIERNFGEMQGLTWDQFTEKYPNLKLGNTLERQTNLPSGETIEQVEGRVKLFIEKIKNEYADTNLLIVTHNGIIRILRRLFANEAMMDSPDSSNLGLTQLTID